MEDSNVRELLNQERVATLARICSMASEFDSIVVSSVESNIDDEHDPEGPTIAFERAQLAALLSEARTYLGDLDRSLEKLGEGTYGVCECCGAPIALERLLARPTTQFCIHCATSQPPRA
jgi:RNA polymerase-binding transcription factor